MGLLDVLTGKRKLAKPAPDRLFAISTAYVTMQTSLEITSRGAAAIVFQSLQTADFTQIVRDMEEVVRATAGDSGTTVDKSTDEFGFSWLVLRGDDFDSLVVGVNAVATSIGDGGYGERLLCAVFAFADQASPPRPLYLIYNFKRGAFYPFVPAAGSAGTAGEAGGPASPGVRDNERELVLRAQLGSELPIETELSRWFALWGIPI